MMNDGEANRTVPSSIYPSSAVSSNKEPLSICKSQECVLKECVERGY